MKPESTTKHSPVTPTPALTPAQTTGKLGLWILAIVYALWLAGLAYVAWVNVQAGNQ